MTQQKNKIFAVNTCTFNTTMHVLPRCSGQEEKRIKILLTHQGSELNPVFKSFSNNDAAHVFVSRLLQFPHGNQPQSFHQVAKRRFQHVLCSNRSRPWASIQVPVVWEVQEIPIKEWGYNSKGKAAKKGSNTRPDTNVDNKWCRTHPQSYSPEATSQTPTASGWEL